MKKLLIVSNVLFLGIIIFQACRTAVLPSIPISNSTYCTTCNQDLVGHTAWEFSRVVSRYKGTHSEVINNDVSVHSYLTNTNPAIVLPAPQTQYEDARAVWFPLDTLKKFICNIEKYSSRINAHSNELGIRFYYATYPGNFTDHQERSGQHTIFMAPTINVEGETEAVDFDPRLTAENYTSTGILTMQYLAGLINDASPTQLLICGPPAENYRPGFSYPGITSTNPSTQTSRFIWNDGRLCPTNCPTGNYTINSNNNISTVNYNTLTTIDALWGNAGLNYNQ